MWKSKMGKEGNLKTLACPLCPACHFALPVRTKKLLRVMCHHTQTEAAVLPITSWLILYEVLNALPRYSMVASVHDYCIFKLFNNRAHSPQKEYRFLCVHVPSSTIPHFLLPASYIVLWKVATWRNKTAFIKLRRSVEVLVEVWSVEVPVDQFESYPGNDVFVKIWAILTFFQKCIEALIDKQYLERREGTKDEYTYMAWRDSSNMAKMIWSLKCIWRSLPDNSPLSWTKTTKVCPGFYARAFLHL